MGEVVPIVRDPALISGRGIVPGQKIATTAFVTDVTPTILELAGAETQQPKGEVQITGRSMLPALTGKSTETRLPEEFVGTEVSGNSALFQGHYKIVRYAPPYGDNGWHLFDLAVDPGETNDLAPSQPDLLKSMLAQYATYEKQMGVLPLPPGYDVQKQVAINSMLKQVKAYWWVLAILAVFIGGIAWFLLRLLLRLLRPA